MSATTNGSDPLTTVAVSTTPGTPAQETTAVPVTEPVPEPQSGATAMPLAESPPESAQEFHEDMGVGTEGEINIWEARYSMKNFLGRLIFWGAVAVAWGAFAVWVWGYEHRNWDAAAIVSGIVLAFFWIALIRRIILARYGHYYRLTNRRIFVSTGVITRRRDQMELLRINDIYTRQTLIGRWLSVGTVVVVSSEAHLPMVYLTGVDDPKSVMDLIWHHARSERDRRSVKVDQV